jgi:hypothetical protein
MNRSRRLPLIVALLLVVSAVLFAVGTVIEHSQRAHHDVHAVASPATKGGETSTEKTANGESSGSGESSTKAGETKPAESASPAVASGESGGETHSEKIAGVDPESWPLVGLAIAISLLIAAGVYRRRGRWLAAAVAFAILFAAGDIRELVHQIQESRTTVATIAASLIALHLLIAATAAAAIRQRRAEARPMTVAS